MSNKPLTSLVEYRIVLLDELIQQRALGPMPRIAWGPMKGGVHPCRGPAEADMQLSGHLYPVR